MTPFARIEARAAERKGGAKALEKLLAKPRGRAALAKIPDDVFLSAIAKQIFRTGFVWKIVDNKWPAIEEAFAGFDPEIVAGFGPAEIEDLVADPRAIRHRGKIESIRDNAGWVLRVAHAQGGFGRYLGEWPDDDVVGLWADLAREGSRLGGMSGPIFLREVGKDTFLLSPDVVKALRREKVIRGEPTTTKNLAAAQQAFNQWRAESGRPFCQLSKILACSV